MLAENEIRAEWIRAGMPTVDGPIMVDVELRVKSAGVALEENRCAVRRGWTAPIASASPEAGSRQRVQARCRRIERTSLAR
jgi:hypothetical protein